MPTTATRPANGTQRARPDSRCGVCNAAAVHVFSLWSPFARSVELELTGSGERLPMSAGPDGWWTLEVPTAGHGTDYGYRLDGEGPLPDPRSAWQPDGVHGPSRLFDAGLHRWQDTGWTGRSVLGAVFYELHVGTFTAEGTLAAAEQRLDHLVELGVDMVELMPLAAFPGSRGWGYDGVGPYAVHEPYGGPAGAAAVRRRLPHARGLGVCLDVVYNHLGPEGNYLPRFGPYFTAAHDTPWGEAVNLDGPGAAEVRRWICDNALRWFEDFHVDALRLDAVHALVDDLAAAPAGPARRRGGGAGGAAGPPARSGRRERPERPRDGRADRDRRAAG